MEKNDEEADVHQRAETEAESEDEYKTPFTSFYKEVVFVLTIMSGQIFTQAGVAQANTPLQIIGDYFGDYSMAFRSWYVAAFSLTVGTFILIAGRLGDMYGHKRLLMAGYAWYALWSLLGGIAKYCSTSTFFIVCRAFQGIGPAVIVPTSMAIIGRTYPDGRRRHMVFAFFGSCNPGGYFIGSLFSSLLAQFAGWEWSYYVMAIACALFYFISWYAIPKDPDYQNDETFDYCGAFTGVSGLVIFNVAWNQAPIVGWETPYTYVLLIIGVLFLAAFVYVEGHVAKHPLVPAFSGQVALVLGVTACGWVVFGIMVFNLWQFLEVLRGVTPLGTTVQMIPCAIVGFFIAVLTGYLVSRIPTSLIMFMALVVFTAVSILCATTPVDQTYWAQTFVTYLIMNAGMEFSFPAATILVSSQMPKKQQGVAASLVATCVNYSISVGLGFAGTVQAYTYPGEDPHSILMAIRVAFYFGIGVGGLGMLLSLVSLYKEVVIDKKRAIASSKEKVGPRGAPDH